MRTLVVGAGLAGLIAARERALAGDDVEVWEAAANPGGSIAAAPLGGVTADVGAEAFMASSAAVMELCEELGLGTEAPAAGGSHVWSAVHGRPVAIPARSLLGMPADPTAPEVRDAIGSLGVVRARLDRVLPASTGRDARDPFSLAWRRMGRRVAERLVAPIAGTIHGADARTLDVDVVCRGLKDALREHGSLAAAVASLRDGASPVRSVSGGMHRLISTLAREVRVISGREATSLVRCEPGESATWTVRAADGSEWSGNHVIIASNARSLHSLLSPHDAEFAAADPAVRDGAAVRLVTLLVHAPELTRAPVGTGLLAGADSGMRAKALTHVNHKWPTVGAHLRDVHGPDAHLLRVSYGRRGESLPEIDVAGAIEDAAVLLGVELHEDQVLATETTTWTMTASSQDASEFGRLAEEAASRLGLGVTGAAVAGTGLAAVVPHARRTARAKVTAESTASRQEVQDS